MKKEKNNMDLSELAFACHLYSPFSDYDNSYLQLLKDTNHSIDIFNSNHRQSIISWLNKWGCRNFAQEYHKQASNELLKWYKYFKDCLPNINDKIWGKKEEDFDIFNNMYLDLMNRKASLRKEKNNQTDVRFGPTCSAKILFALRPNMFLPWDRPIRDAKHYKEYQYIKYLKEAHRLSLVILEKCNNHNIDINDLPKKLNRPNSTISKLIDEYFWVTITKKCEPPSKKTLQIWIDLSDNNAL